MRAAPIPADDAARVAALRALGVLGTRREERFDRITRVARTALRAPVVLVSLVDEDTAWVKSAAGTDLGEIPREISLCAWVLLADGLFEVPDLTHDARFADHPLVIGGPGFRHYAGQPLVTSAGHRIGAICVLDVVPRTLTADERTLLADLAAGTVDHLENRALTRAVAAAEEAGRAKSAFLATMSHELRTPLNAIIGYSELLIDDAPHLGAEGLVADLGKIADAGHHLLGLIGQVLDLAKLEAGAVASSAEPIAVAAFAAGVLEAIAPHARGNRLGLRVEEPPPALRADPTLLAQALRHLLDNACKFTPAGEVVLSVATDGDACVFAVDDTGPGIAPEAVERLFTPFTQGDDSTTRRVGGAGLGLPLARRLVALMGGELTVESTPGRGSRFSVRLPLARRGAGPGPRAAA
jgi:signal transduction histidine kinase